MKALLLGKPFHGERREVAGRPHRIRLEAFVQEQGHGGCGANHGYRPRQAAVVEYCLLDSPSLPRDALVYVRSGYEPPEEDAELVFDAFG